MPPPILIPAEKPVVTAVNPLLIVAALPEALFSPVMSKAPSTLGVSDPGCNVVLAVAEALPVTDSNALADPEMASTPTTAKPPVTVNVWLAPTIGLSQ